MLIRVVARKTKVRSSLAPQTRTRLEKKVCQGEREGRVPAKPEHCPKDVSTFSKWDKCGYSCKLNNLNLNLNLKFFQFNSDKKHLTLGKKKLFCVFFLVCN